MNESGKTAPWQRLAAALCAGCGLAVFALFSSGGSMWVASAAASVAAVGVAVVTFALAAQLFLWLTSADTRTPPKGAVLTMLMFGLVLVPAGLVPALHVPYSNYRTVKAQETAQEIIHWVDASIEADGSIPSAELVAEQFSIPDNLRYRTDGEHYWIRIRNRAYFQKGFSGYMSKRDCWRMRVASPRDPAPGTPGAPVDCRDRVDDNIPTRN